MLKRGHDNPGVVQTATPRRTAMIQSVMIAAPRRLLTSAIVIALALAEVGAMRQHVLADMGDESQADLPDTVADLLERGLANTAPTHLWRWRESHARLVEDGIDPTRADEALAIILARAGRYEEMQKTLISANERSPHDMNVVRLLSWARLSDRRILEGLQDVCVLSENPQGGQLPVDAAGCDAMVTYAGQAFGFADAVVDDVQPTARAKVNELIEGFDATVPAELRPAFELAKGAMRAQVLEALGEIKGQQQAEAGRQREEKDAARNQLEGEQREMEADAQQRIAEAADIRRRAEEQLLSLQQKMAPLYAQLRPLQSELAALKNKRTEAKSETEKKAFDPAIGTLKAQIAAVESQLAPMQSQYRRIAGGAASEIGARGASVAQLNQLHGRNRQKLRTNDARSELGMTPKVAQEMRVRTRFATYVPLNFKAERDRLAR